MKENCRVKTNGLRKKMLFKGSTSLPEYTDRME